MARAGGIALLAAVLILLGPSALAQTLRITTWNLETPAARQTNGLAVNTNGFRIPAAARALRQLDPDVILLQQVRDWEVCAKLAQALRPAKYNVVVCSAFADVRTGELRKQQVAILAKRKAYFSWSEPWRGKGGPVLPGGYAFAAFQVGKQRVGVFSAAAAPAAGGPKAKQLDLESRQARSAAAANQLLDQVGSINHWVANRVQVFVVGGTFGGPGRLNAGVAEVSVELLENAGFGDALLELTGAERITQPGRGAAVGAIADFLFAQPAGCTINPGILSMPAFKHYPATCEVSLGPAAAIAAQTGEVVIPPARSAEPPTTKTNRPTAAAPPLPAEIASPPSQPSPPRPAAQTAQVETQVTSPTVAPVPSATVAASQASAVQPQWSRLGAALAVTAAAAALTWLTVRRRRSLTPRPPALLTAGGDQLSSYTVVVGTRSATETVPANAPPPPAPQPIIHVETGGETQTQAEALRQRAQAAEQRAEQAHAVIRQGLIPHLRQWLKQKLVRKLISERAQMLETQHTAARKAIAVEARLARIEQQVQQQNHAYQVRIEELTRELLSAKEENRELIRARIAQVKAEMEAVRTRLMAQSAAQGEENT